MKGGWDGRAGGVALRHSTFFHKVPSSIPSTEREEGEGEPEEGEKES